MGRATSLRAARLGPRGTPGEEAEVAGLLTCLSLLRARGDKEVLLVVQEKFTVFRNDGTPAAVTELQPA